MANQIKWDAEPSLSTLASTGLNSLADGSTELSATTYDNGNAANLNTHALVELVLASFTGAIGGYVAVWFLRAADGTNFEMGSDGASPTLPTRPPDCVFGVTSTAQAYRLCEVIEIPPVELKPLILNMAGAALAASANTLKIGPFNHEVQ